MTSSIKWRGLLTASLVLVVALQFAAPSLDAQILVDPATGSPLSSRSRLENLAINGAIGSVSGLLWSVIRHSSKPRGAAQGAVGGLLMSVGRQLAASTFQGGGFLGREISAAGVSLTATSGQPKTTLTLPLGPLSLERSDSSFDWRLNLADFVATAGLALSTKTRLDLGRSLSSGAPVFRDRRSSFGRSGTLLLTAVTQLGTIRLSRGAFDPFIGDANVVFHENVHILQEDYFEETVALPAEREVIQHLPFGSRFLRHLDLGVLGPTFEGAVLGLIPYQSRPWEREAYALTANLDY